MGFLILVLIIAGLLVKEKIKVNEADEIGRWAVQNGVKRRTGESNEAFSRRLEEGYRNSHK